MQRSEVPFFSQWETPDMTLPLLAEGPAEAFLFLLIPVFAAAMARGYGAY